MGIALDSNCMNSRLARLFCSQRMPAWTHKLASAVDDDQYQLSLLTSELFDGQDIWRYCASACILKFDEDATAPGSIKSPSSRLSSIYMPVVFAEGKSAL